MTASITLFPPSPALSVCDSLADIDDLDAFLSSQGALSHFSTPPLKPLEVVNDDDDDAAEHDKLLCHEEHESAQLKLDYTSVATHFQSAINLPEPNVICALLFRAQLPPEILAIAYNILTHYRQLDPDHCLFPTELLTVSCLVLATSCASDHAPSLKYWADRVCDGAWTAQQIDHMVLHVLTVLDWNLHGCTAPFQLESALRVLSTTNAYASIMQVAPPPPTAEGKDLGVTASDQMPPAAPALQSQSKAILVDWEHGQLTPETTPPCTAVASPVLDRFVVLL